MKQKVLLTLLGGLLAACGIAQSSAFSAPLLLKNETIHPAELQEEQAVPWNGHYFVIIQHPKLELKKDFYGFHSFEYLPKHSAFAQVAEENWARAQQELQDAGGRIVKIRDTWKLGNRLFREDYPEWAWQGDDRLKIWLRHWPQVKPGDAQQAVRNAGFEITDRNPSENLLAVDARPEQVAALARLPMIYYIQVMEDPGEPENFESRIMNSIPFLQRNPAEGLEYDGSGVVIGHNDAGMLGEHMDYKGRLTQVGNSSSTSTHGDHTAGTIFGAGNINPRAEGMAPGAEMYYTTYPGNLNDADNIYVSQNARFTSNSFSNGCNAGYTNFTRQMDQDAQDNPNMLHVFSAGNNGTSNCGYGAGSGWGNVTGGHKIAKNVIATANVLRNDNRANSSSKGPASDGRIKPDISALGTQVLSTVDDPSDNSYDRSTGTSMACPAITGSLAVLLEAYKDEHNGNEPHGTLLKGMLLNGADDLGNKGPDFEFGYGRANVKGSYQMLTNDQFFQDSVGLGDSASFQINVPSNTAQLRVMLIWTDPPASTSASRALVNDLDLSLSDGSTSFQPWVLDPTPNAANLASPASPARDSLNNIEQITVDNPSAGTFTAQVEGFNVPAGNQSFYLLYYFEDEDVAITYPQPGQAIEPGNAYVSWDAPGNGGPLTVQLSTNGGNSYSTGATVNASNNHTDLFIPNQPSDQAYLRVINSNDTAVSGPFTIVQTPGNLRLDKACPDSVTLRWNPISGASGYVIYRLGAQYMDSIAYVQNQDSAVLAHNPAQEDFYAIASVLNDSSVGFRSTAIEKESGIKDCQVAEDISLEQVLSPGQGELPNCYDPNSLPLTVRIANRGKLPISNFDVSYQRRNTLLATENVPDTLLPGQSMDFTFQTTGAVLLNNFRYELKFWVTTSQGPDMNPFNDTTTIDYQSYTASGATLTLPDSNDFENFQDCGTDSDCGLTSCPLSDGWRNATNMSSDDIDWRVNAGTTPSSSTGPIRDHKPGTSTGNYVYTEASSGCDSAVALLMTPCIDLSNTYKPEASIWYHMSSARDEIGKLDVDVYDGEKWHFSIASTIKGDQGGSWLELITPLDSFVGKTITIRYRGKTGSGWQSDLALDDWSIYETSGIGIKENALGQLTLFPNPSSGRFTLRSSQVMQAGTIYRVRDLTGKLILERSAEEDRSEVQFDLQEQPKGVYLLQIELEDGSTERRRLIVQ